MFKIIKLYLFSILLLNSCSDINYTNSCDKECSKNEYCTLIDGFPECMIQDKSWIKIIPGNSGNMANFLTIDSENNLYILGNFSSYLDFDPSDAKDIRVTKRECTPNSCEHCSNNEFCYNEECLCKEGFHKEEEACVLTCQLSCEENQKCVLDDKNKPTCDCKNGYHMFFDECLIDTCEIELLENEYCLDGIATCKNGFTQNTNNELFISKFDDFGNYLWTKVLGDFKSRSIKGFYTDKNNDIYILGTFNGLIDFDHTSGIDIHNSNGVEKTFITKINPSGSYLWTLTLDVNSPKEIYIDRDNLYIVGDFSGKAHLGNDSYNSNNDSNDIFIAKFKTDKTYLWSKAIGGTGYDSANSIAMDSQKNIYVVGTYENSVDFNTTDIEDIHTSVGQTDIFITKINSAGAYMWTKTTGGVNIDGAEKIKIDKDDNIIISGHFSDSILFDSKLYESYGNTDIFIAKINSDGKFKWINITGGPDWDVPQKGLVVDKRGDIYYIGLFLDSIIINGENVLAKGYVDSFLKKIDNEGNDIWTKIISSTEEESFDDVKVGKNDNIFVIGYYKGEAEIFFDNKKYKSKENNNDIFLFKYVE